MLFALYLFAQNEGAKPAGGVSLFDPQMMLTLWLPLFVVFYFFVLRPGQRQEKERKAMVAALKKGDRVIAAGGLLGTVYAYKENEDEVTLKVDEGRIKVLRSSIMRVVRDEEAKTDGKVETKG